MSYSEEEFLKKVNEVQNGEIEVIGRFKGTQFPILVKDKYGLLEVKKANNLFKFKPGIAYALNKTDYFMNQLKEKHPEIAEQLTPMSEYEKAKSKMLFNTKFGLVSATPDTLMAGHCPNIRSAIDRKDYFKNQLLYLYENKYDFEITSTDRHKGRVILICPIHGKQSVDSDGIFLGIGCPECNCGWTKSDTFYLVRLYDEFESFYKLGISYKKNNTIRRFKDYENLGYSVEVLKIINFDNSLEAKEFELKMKHIIKPYLYTPERWENNTSTECFIPNALNLILEKLNHDIVSSSDESQSSSEMNGKEVTNPSEDYEI